jgi:anti-sigma regulatory factor (Ser/Thr protein kinase)
LFHFREEAALTVSTTHSLTLQHELHAPARARAWLSAQLPQVPGQAAEDALLIVSELVTNAVRHGAPDIVVSLDLRADRIHLEVRDGGTQLPVVPGERPAPDRSTGRGLLIVAATAADWGVTTDAAPGKRVWADLSL